MITVVGWDIGGANVKAAWLACEHGAVIASRVASRPFEIWRRKDRLPAVLAELLAEVARAAAGAAPKAMAITMTAELSDVFATKREGVDFVAASVERLCARGARRAPACYALCLDGELAPLAEAHARPLDFAAANWLASALWIARQCPDCLLVDAGSTTTDIIPIVRGRPAAQGRTDLDRLLAGELVYTGALRTHLAAIVHAVPVRGRLCPVSSEYFAISGDVHLILGGLAAADYTCPTPDGGEANLAGARQRLARLVCADTEQLGPAEIDGIAGYLYEAQLRQICDGLLQVLSRLPGRPPVVAMGLGAFLARAAAARLGLALAPLPELDAPETSAVAPSWAVARLLAEQLEPAP